MRYNIATEEGFNCGVAKYDVLEDSSVIFKYCYKKLPETKETCVTGKTYLSFPDEVPLQGRLNVSIGTESEFDPQ